jgi:uncharacterized protein YbbC (DUF1343 family)
MTISKRISSKIVLAWALSISASAWAAADAGVPSLHDGIERLVGEAMGQGKLPGCVVVVGRGSGVVYQNAFGSRALQPQTEAMGEDTIFDLASLTKPLATATALMVLLDQGKIDLDQPAARYLPEFAAKGKGAITIRQLLTHVSGLPSETAMDDYQHGWREAVRRLAGQKLKVPPGSKLIYSDAGFLVLQEIVRRVSGQDFSAFTQNTIFKPLGMVETGFLPDASLRPRIAPTEQRDGAWMRGQVHDPRAFRLGGVAGHAGLFAPARDLVRFARMLLGGGALDGTRVLSEATLRKMLAPHDVPGGIRALGWDMQSGYSSNRGTSFFRRAVGHGGYTGTSLWVDPELDLFVIFLSNRVHPNGKGSVNALAGAIGTLAGKLFAPAEPESKDLLLGIEALAKQKFARLQGTRFALLTNDAARTRAGERTTDVLAAQHDLKLVALLSPEHGLSASRDEVIKDDRDQKTGIPVFSLYGGSMSKRTARGERPVTLPPDIDAVVVDLPDVGARFFTYAGTLHMTMRAAAERGLRVIILDRPNPINATDVAGPMLKAGQRSAVNHHPLPVRHGMTMAELAELMNADEHLGLRLEVVRMAHYDRKAYFAETGLHWWPPSPNLRTAEQALLYPGLALIEGTNVSVGRGTDTPFEVVGAPWMDGPGLAAELTRAGLAGVRFEPTSFIPNPTPKVNRFAGTPCQGIRVAITDPASFEPVRTGLALARALQKLHGRDWDSSRLHRALGDPRVAQAIIKQQPANLESIFQEDVATFRSKRTKYLLYTQ